MCTKTNFMFMSLVVAALSGCGKTMSKAESAKLAAVPSSGDALYLAPGTIVNLKEELTLLANSGTGLESWGSEYGCRFLYEKTPNEQIIGPNVLFSVEKVEGKFLRDESYTTSCVGVGMRKIFLKSKGGFPMVVACPGMDEDYYPSCPKFGNVPIFIFEKYLTFKQPAPQVVE